MVVRAGEGGAGLVVFSDYVCPYCYLAEKALGRLRGEGVAIEYRALELRPAPAPLLDPRGEYLSRVWRETVYPLAAEWGVELRQPPIQPRSRKAHEAARIAGAAGRFLEMHEAIFRAFFVEGRDIGRIDVLVEVGAAVGVDAGLLKVELDVDKYADAVAADAALAAELGVTGVPTFLAGGERLVGLQSYETLHGLIGGTPAGDR
jgi:predicted DsbA family dithiol-disulfide isomerase